MLVRTSGVQSVFQFIPKVFSGVEVRALCRTLEFFHSNLHTPRLHGARFVHRGIVMLEQKQLRPEAVDMSKLRSFWHNNKVLIVMGSGLGFIHWARRRSERPIRRNNRLSAPLLIALLCQH
ncbi:hypothetical protein PDJAM_G00161710 [Pangasius djambal]|uniref:Uncharacterized protein n=1 Tax=Pangasius djambal TaxID=1691987 RepID=A0ACC5ZJE0_9TELE|nr:hypothetical protein [Pangasius djambal]